MNHSNIRERDEDIMVFCKSPIFPAVKIYKVKPPLYQVEDITPAGLVPINIIEDYYKCPVHTPDEHCFLYMTYGDLGIIMRVGTPRYVYFLVSVGFTEGMNIQFRQISFDGTIMLVDQLNEAGKGLYFHEITAGINDSFVEVSGYGAPVRPYLSVSSKIINYELLYNEYDLILKNNLYKIGISLDDKPLMLRKDDFKYTLKVENNITML